jgi:predicted nucleic acid-binding protein
MTSKRFARVAGDSNVLASAAVGLAAERVFSAANAPLVVTAEPMLQETLDLLPELADRYRLDLDDVGANLVRLPIRVYQESEYRSHIALATRYLGKRDPSDIPLAAVALKLRIPIWSNDDDFRELPLPFYPTAVLLKLLGL